jgi:hypothetical protein
VILAPNYPCSQLYLLFANTDTWRSSSIPTTLSPPAAWGNESVRKSAPGRHDERVAAVDVLESNEVLVAERDIASTPTTFIPGAGYLPAPSVYRSSVLPTATPRSQGRRGDNSEAPTGYRDLHPCTPQAAAKPSGRGMEREGEPSSGKSSGRISYSLKRSDSWSAIVSGAGAAPSCSWSIRTSSS